LRNNTYKISDGKSESIFSGEEFCENTVLIEKTNKIDLYKIAYATGFKKGRKTENELYKNDNIQEKINDNSLFLIKG
jgi:hypothetical protein